MFSILERLGCSLFLVGLIVVHTDLSSPFYSCITFVSPIFLLHMRKRLWMQYIFLALSLLFCLYYRLTQFQPDIQNYTYWLYKNYHNACRDYFLYSFKKKGLQVNDWRLKLSVNTKRGQLIKINWQRLIIRLSKLLLLVLVKANFISFVGRDVVVAVRAKRESILWIMQQCRELIILWIKSQHYSVLYSRQHQS